MARDVVGLIGRGLQRGTGSPGSGVIWADLGRLGDGSRSGRKEFPRDAGPGSAENRGMADSDLSRILEDWPYEQGRVTARLVDAPDGERQLLQVRLELGILQMEVDGRPDGARPDGAATVLDVHRGRLESYRDGSGATSGFVLGPDDCRALRDEAAQFHHRYVALFAIGEYGRVARDAAHNLEILDFCRDYAAEEQDRTVLEQLRAHLIMMQTRADAEDAIAGRSPRDAMDIIDGGLAAIAAALATTLSPEQIEALGETQLLRGMRDALVPKLPSSQRAELEERIRAAIEAENYELAAILRDELRLM